MSKWEMVKLGEVFSSIRNGANIKQGMISGGYPITRIETISNCVIDRNRMGYAGIKEISSYKGYVLEHGDILMSHINSEKHLGKTACYELKDKETIIHGMNLLCLKVNTERLFYKFANYFFGSLLFKQQIPRITKKSVNQASFTVTALKQLLIPLPPLEVQRKIAETLDAAAALLALRKEQLAEMDNLIKSVFYEMFGDPVMNEKGWSIEKFGKLGELGRGISKHRPRNDPKLLNGIYPLIQTGDVANAGLYINQYTQTYSELGLKQSKMWEKGTLCITIAANIAKTAILGFDACFPDSVVGFKPYKYTNEFFVNTWFAFFQKIIEDQAPESAQKNINLKILNDLEIISPPLPLQTQFAEIVTKIEEQKALVQKAIDESQYLFDSLMNEYFN